MSPDAGSAPLVNAARYTLYTSPLIAVILDEFAIYRGDTFSTLRWAKRDLFVDTRSPLALGRTTMPAFSYDSPIHFYGDTLPDESWCGGDCEGTSTVSLDLARGGRIVDLKLKVAGGIGTCKTRYRVTTGQDASATYQECADDAPCLDSSDCCCRPIVPCSGAVAHSWQEFCANLDYGVLPCDISIEANGHVPD